MNGDQAWLLYLPRKANWIGHIVRKTAYYTISSRENWRVPRYQKMKKKPDDNLKHKKDTGHWRKKPTTWGNWEWNFQSTCCQADLIMIITITRYKEEHASNEFCQFLYSSIHEKQIIFTTILYELSLF